MSVALRQPVDLFGLQKVEHRIYVGLTLPAVILVVLVIVLPVGGLFWLSLVEDGAFSLIHYARLIHSPTYANVFLTTFEVSAVVTVLALLAGYPVAYVLVRLPAFWRNLCLIAVVLPFWTSLLVRTYAWLVLLQRRGVVNTGLEYLGLINEPLQLVHNMTGTVIGMTHIMLPFLILPLYGAMNTIDKDYVRAATSLGASPFRAFWHIFLPLSVPGLTAGVLLVFVLSIGFFVTPALLGGGRVVMVAMRVERSVSLFPSWGAASALGVVLLVVTALLLFIAARCVTFTLLPRRK
jgi:putative spermidine/putrescine transport system permease protein/spermidine/putrescine transport system permease protein